ncbi:MAG TPA: DUF547 domain-containing protein [Oculatellaceae cyanobacterium]
MHRLHVSKIECLTAAMTFAAWSVCCFLLSTTMCAGSAQTSQGFDVTHKLFSSELNKYVKQDHVDYAQWKKKTAPLNSYLDSIATLSQDEYKQLQENDRKALWINASNALTIKLVLDNYPLAGKNPDYPLNSFRQIPDAWETMHFKVASQDVTLDQIEHTILRRDFHDCRTHFAVVCAAKGSPHLRNQAFIGQDLDARLDECRDSFLSDSQNVAFDKNNKTLKVSKLFQWFALDFAPKGWCKKYKGKMPTDEQVIFEYLADNGTPSLKSELKETAGKNPVPDATQPPVRIEYTPFNWALNDMN